MSILKFRCWDGISNYRMQYFNSLQEIADYYRGHKYQVEMQCTGLEDKNGKEIYEGDLVVYEYSNSPDQIVWDNKGFWSPYSGGHTIPEVIGNIYENPELLGK